VPERNATAIAAAIVRIEADPDASRRLGAAARAFVSARFGWQQTAERFEAAYDRALAFKSRSS
jgi:starch synthase